MLEHIEALNDFDSFKDEIENLRSLNFLKGWGMKLEETKRVEV